MAHGDVHSFGTFQDNSTGSYMYQTDTVYCESNFYDHSFTFLDTNNSSYIWNWVETNINGKKYYISKSFLFVNITYDTVVQNINKTYYVNNKNLKLVLLTCDEWLSLDYSIINQLDFYSPYYHSEYAWTSTISSDDYINTVTFNNGYYESTAYDKATQSYDVGFIPVLLDLNASSSDTTNSNLNTVEFGRLQVTKSDGSKLFLYPTSPSGNIVWSSTYDSFTIVDSSSTAPALLEWIVDKYNGSTIYLSKNPIFLGIDIYKYILNTDTTVYIDDRRFTLKPITAKNLLSGYDTYYAGDILTSLYANNSLNNGIVTTTIEGNYYACYEYINGSWFKTTYVNMYSNTIVGDSFRVYVYLIEENTPPTISGTDKHLGNKAEAFSVSYTVNDVNTEQSLTISEKLNGTTIRTINNATRGQTYTFNITTKMFNNLATDSEHVISITVSDSDLHATRTYTFKKAISSPIINYSGSSNLGVITYKPTINYYVSSESVDSVTITEKINDVNTRTFTASTDTTQTFNITDKIWSECKNGQNTLEICVVDNYGNSVSKTIYFARSINKINVQTLPVITGTMCTKVSLELIGDLNNAKATVLVCNNALDDVPTWEDMSAFLGNDNMYEFINVNKTSNRWAISVNVIIEKNKGYTGTISLDSIKGSYE